MSPSIDDSYRFLAAWYLRQQAKQLATELVGVRESIDVEHVHQARVASRRLRAALGLFSDCLPAQMVSRWRKASRRVTTELGTARDCDVHAQELTEQLVGLKKRAASRAVARLLVDLERAREACQPMVLREIDRIERSGVLEEILHLTKEMLVDVDKSYKGNLRRVKPQDVAYTPVVFRRVGKRIRAELAELKSYQDSLASPKNKKQHHQMRIAAKRLRYTMEIVRPVYRGRLDKSIAVVKRLQTVLGDIHDCDVWCVKLDEFKCFQREQIIDTYGNTLAFDELEKGLNLLRKQCKARRNKHFNTLVKLWKKLKRKGRWDDLLKTIDHKPSRKAKRKVKRKAAGKSRLCNSGRRCHLCKRRNTCPKLRSAIDSGLMPVSVLDKIPASTAKTDTKKAATKKMATKKKQSQKKRIQPKRSADSQ